MASNGRLPDRQQAAALLLARGLTVRAAAVEAHVSERSLHRWLEVRTFRRRVEELRGELFALAVGKLTDISAKAADVLAELLASDTETVRLSAARAVLESTPRLRQVAELEARLQAVEELLAKEEA